MGKSMKIKEAYPYTKAAIKRFAEKFPPPAKVIDVGTQDGYAIHLLKKRGYEAYGTEIDQAYAEFCNEQGHKVWCDNFQETKVDDTFDIVYSSHVIEHCDEPLKFMESAHKILKPQGILFMYFPLEDKTFDKKHYGRMRHRSFWKDLETFRENVSSKSKFKEIELYITRTWRTHIEGLFIGEKI